MDATQCKMARAAIEWSAQRLADESGVHYATVARFEGGGRIAESSLGKLRAALEAQGARFSEWKERVGVTVPHKLTLDERRAGLRSAKAGLAKVQRAIKGAKLGAE